MINMKKNRKLADAVADFVYRYKQQLLVAAIFVISFAAALAVYHKLKLPFSNPWGITGPLTVIRYNPANDLVRFIFLVVTPGAAIALAFLNRTTRGYVSTKVPRVLDFKDISEDSLWAKRVVYVLVLVALFVIAGDYYNYENGSAGLDTFHEGEGLGPAIDYLNGKAPYKDTLFAHGVFQDPVRAILAFKIFGKSIAAVRMLESLLRVVTFLLFFITVYFLCGRNIYFTCVSFFPLMMLTIAAPLEVGFYFEHRVSVMLVFLILAVFIKETLTGDALKNRRLRTNVLLFLFTFVSSSSFAYSIDVGFFVFAASVIYVAIIYFLYLKSIDAKYIFSILAGYVSGMIVLGFAIRWAYYDFFKFAFIIMPRFKELMDGFVYEFRKTEFLVPVLLMSGWAYWLVYRFANLNVQDERNFIVKFKSFYSAYFVEILLLILSVFCFRGSLGRSDVGHVWAWAGPIYILTSYIVIKHYLLRALSKIKKRDLVCVVASITVMAVFWWISAAKINWKQWYKFPLGKADAELIPINYRMTISFLKKNLGADENFFTLTSEAMWYYFIDKPCPSRFNVVWFAMPHFFQKEITEDLEKNNVKFILYRNNFPTNAIDGFDNERRLPIVIDYIKQNYAPFVKIYDNEIWARKSR